jgi:FixJ family two-component response regulator
MLSPLTSFERDVLARRITKGHSAKRVAQDLGISLAEVRTIQHGALRRILPSAH